MGGVINTVAGSSAQGYSGDGGPATAAGLYNASDVAFDAAGNMYIADTVDQRVRIVSKGIITTLAGGGSGADEYDEAIPATDAYFDSVESVAGDSAGNVYVSDGGANRVFKISNGIMTTFAGNGTRGSKGMADRRPRPSCSDPVQYAWTLPATCTSPTATIMSSAKSATASSIPLPATAAR